ncbi:hypothetical protein D3C71_1908210 [compost metagenome]
MNTAKTSPCACCSSERSVAVRSSNSFLLARCCTSSMISSALPLPSIRKRSKSSIKFTPPSFASSAFTVTPSVPAPASTDWTIEPGRISFSQLRRKNPAP